MKTTTKKSKASRVHPKKPARTACRAFDFEATAGSVICTQLALGDLKSTAFRCTAAFHSQVSLISTVNSHYAGNCFPLVSAPKGINNKPTPKASAVSATGIPREPYR